ncbi:tellurite resistance TerB family protein [Sulfurimonas sp. SAG-AH-194-I05]|nr:TerB family tellurite resistance protein [Sulfurimonas sp. SAG-AH-194-I05]MDF1874623.1 tellurite resistance TerB family protein [Sulfurimonas sp. SAG-AH-194-I05]
MLLMQLKNNEKFAFLNLAYYIANIDGEFEQEEKNTIEEYCAEMGIENVAYNEDMFSLEDTLKQISSLKSKKIVLMELMILIHSDDKFHRFEQGIIEKIADNFYISKNQLVIYSQWGKMASSLYQQGNLFLEDGLSV